MPGAEAVIELVDVLDQSTLLVEESTVEVLELQDEETIVLEETIIEIVSEAIQGPAGPPGIAEDAVPYAKRTDFVGDDVIYKGFAAPGASESAPVWQICRLTISNNDIAEQWAGGTAAFDKAWTGRLTLEYV